MYHLQHSRLHLLMQSECPILYSPLLTSVGKREGESLHKAQSPGPEACPPATYCGSDGCEGNSAAQVGGSARPRFQLQSLGVWNAVRSD